MTEIEKPSLFGIKHSNRDFSDRDAWGKNQFNSSFPTALSAYLADKNLENVYIKLDENLELITTASIIIACRKSLSQNND